MLASNDMKEEAKQLFAYLALTTNNITKLDTLMITLKGLGVNHVKYGLIPEHFPLVGGIVLKSVALALEIIEFIGDSFFCLMGIFIQLSSIENANK